MVPFFFMAYAFSAPPIIDVRFLFGNQLFVRL